MDAAAVGRTTLLPSSALVISTLALPGAARAQSYLYEAVVLEGGAAPGGGVYAGLSTVAPETNAAGYTRSRGCTERRIRAELG